MLQLKLGVDDLVSLRFSCSPLQETVVSLWTWHFPAHYLIHEPLAKGTKRLLSPLDWPLLHTLVGPDGFLPDFLTPTPASPMPDIREELALVRSTAPQTVVDDIVAAANGREVPARLHGVHEDPGGLLEEIVEALWCYWNLALAPHWPRMSAIMEADVLYRAKQLADGGVEGLFKDFDPAIQWGGGSVFVDAPGVDMDVSGDGRGLVLTPSLFCNRAVTTVDFSLAPRILYPARGRGTLWCTQPVDPSEALSALLGRTRARLLTVLGDPTSTTELAKRLGLSPGAVSQHLGILRRSGLIRGSRMGHSVLYSRSPLGDSVFVMHAGTPSWPAESPGPETAGGPLLVPEAG